MPRSNEDFVGQDFRDAGFGTGRRIELTPQERAAALKEREKAQKAEAEFTERAAREPHRPPDIMDAHVAAATAEAGWMLTPAQERNRQLGFVEVDGVLMHVSEARRLEAKHTPDAEGVTPQERAAMEQYLSSDEEEDEEDFWNDITGE